ncbi:toll/interleukin-1 receptor domain-containing protein [Glaciimonas sp. PCH181]|uniref:toll/interleukin-1 receptor domain-containing protein n=1 Tax=Glaciimonas sp. PCH181 TaxID=2133943 RepID=UPI000D35E0D7|nr:toll/interleukin-1 receptor domain-containing protein [Glaciimonas sp. PCH181]PUA19357.1 toll/interleukin-1 receptor domain-containing protein [Glaciimonas sp. PCH181]
MSKPIGQKMKIFISHQQVDSELALSLSKRLLTVHGISTYLDVIDSAVSASGDALADHVKDELGKCTQLLAVVSDATRASWWVPWEIGIATEKDFPLATYAGGYTAVPDYLSKWPYLRSTADLDLYATASKTAAKDFETKRGFLVEATARSRSTKEFYRVLRGSLGQ